MLDDVHVCVSQWRVNCVLRASRNRYETNRQFQEDPKTNHIRFLACDPGIVGGMKLTDSMPWYIRMVMQYVLVPIQTISAWLWAADDDCSGSGLAVVLLG